MAGISLRNRWIQLVIYTLSILLAVETELSFASAVTNTIYVNSKTGNDSLCQKEGSSSSCRSLEGASGLLKRYGCDVRLEIETDVNLSSLFEISNSFNISIRGNDTKICCQSSNAGFKVSNVTNFTFEDITVKNCTTVKNYTTQEPHYYYSSAMLIIFTDNIQLINVHFINCTKTALVFLDNSNLVNISNCTFKNNRMTSFPGAISIEHAIELPVHYNFSECLFDGNESPPPYNTVRNKNGPIIFRGLGYGGAVFIGFGGNANESTVTIQHTNFTNSIGKRGGGLYVYYEGNATNNFVSVEKSIFKKNVANISGGGFQFGFYTQPSQMNSFFIVRCSFTENFASFGAGLSIFSIYDEQHVNKLDSIIRINESYWENNRGVLSSAVDIGTMDSGKDNVGHLPKPQFTDCTFTNNTLINRSQDSNVRHINIGVFFIKKFTVIFQGKTVFCHNRYSAIKLLSGKIKFKENSSVMFYHNTGYNGGAIVMYGFSIIKIHPYSFLNFSNNHALNYGGGIYYHTMDQHSFIFSKHCFIESTTKEVDTIQVVFEGNKADVGGLSIYADSFDSCFAVCKKQLHYNYTSVFKCIGNFTFDQERHNKHALTSSGKTFNFKKDFPLVFEVIPGNSLTISFNITDDFNHTITPLMTFNHFSSNDPTNPVFVTQPYSLNNTLFPLGKPSAISTFTLSVLEGRQIYFFFNITLLPCPPGFHIKDNMCTCASGNMGYPAVVKCMGFSAEIRNDFWVGYIPYNSTDPRDLFFAPCTDPICSLKSHFLPNSSKALTDMICNENREGVLCGKCIQNHSTYYHSRDFLCGHNKYCHYGILFFILSEIIPMVIFFIIVITFDLSFTTGNITSYIFFTQYLNQLTIHVNDVFSYLRMPYQTFYGIFNLGFFHIEEFSFCLWPGASLLDVVAFKYITIATAFGLVLVLIGIMHNNRCKLLCNFRTSVSAKKSVVHGLSAFLVICYSQCTLTSFYILKFARPVGYRGELGEYYTYFGGLEYFHYKHLVYAIPAIFSLLLVTILPPLVLLLYPLMPQLLSLCGLSEHWTVKKILHLFQIHRLVPFIDCFQSCYKDKLRFFAGLYFMYRVLIITCYVIITDAYQFNIYSGVILVIILGMHSTVHPYKEKLHNAIDSLVLLDLILINSCVVISRNLMEHLDNPDTYGSDSVILLITSVQLVLLYLPMVAVLLAIGKVSYDSLQRRFCRNSLNPELTEVEDILDYTSDRSNVSKNATITWNGQICKRYGSIEN